MRVPLVNCRDSTLSFSRTALLHTELATLSGGGNTGVHITRLNSPDLSLVAYTICGIMNGMSTSCVKNVNELKKLCWVFDSAWNILLTAQ